MHMYPAGAALAVPPQQADLALQKLQRERLQAIAPHRSSAVGTRRMSQSLVQLLEGFADGLQHHFVEAPGHLPHRQLDLVQPRTRREPAAQLVPDMRKRRVIAILGRCEHIRAYIEPVARKGRLVYIHGAPPRWCCHRLPNMGGKRRGVLLFGGLRIVAPERKNRSRKNRGLVVVACAPPGAG